jgi:serine protease Do
LNEAALIEHGRRFKCLPVESHIHNFVLMRCIDSAMLPWLRVSRRKGRPFVLSFLGFGLLICSVPAPRLRAQDLPTAIQTDLQRVYEHSKDAVVRIEAQDEHGRLSGSGFLVDPAGTVYTAYEVGGDSHDIIVEFGSKRYPAHRLVADARSGVAILKVDAGTPWLPMGSSDDLRIASPIITVGYPMDLPATPNFGIVGGFDLKYLDRYFSTTLIRANLSAQRGEAGCPVLNLKGEVVAILISSIDNRTACYALPIKAAEKVRTDYLRFGDIRPGWLGVSVHDADEPSHDSHVTISGFVDDSPAAAAGLEIGDVLLQVGTVQIRTAPDVINASFFLTADQTVPVKVVRKDQEMTLNVTAVEHPAFRAERTPFTLPSMPAAEFASPSPSPP